MLSFALTILLDGISYGMILFIISVGLTVTMGLMRVINLAHGSFAMIGGYVAGYLTQDGVDFYLALLAAAVGAGHSRRHRGDRPCIARSTARASSRRCC